MTDLGQSMSSGVGSSRAADMDRLPNDALQRPGQFSLDGSESGLDLPSVITGPIVLDLQPQVSRTRTRALQRVMTAWSGSRVG